MRTFFKHLGSIKLTMTILLLLALGSAFGTFLPRGEDTKAWESLLGDSGTRVAGALGLTDFYHSLWFTPLLAILLANLVACMVSRLPGMLASLSGRTAITGGPVLDLPDARKYEAKAIQALRSEGFRRVPWGGGRVFSRGTAAYLLALLAHASILVITAFSWLGTAEGFVATKRVHVGESTDTAFDWKSGGDRALPFELHVEDLVLLPNPISVRLGVLDQDSRSVGVVITTHEGGTFKVPGVKGMMKLERFDVERKDFQVSWKRTDDGRVGIRRGQPIGDSGFSLVALAYATWPERQVQTMVKLLRPDSEVLSGRISVNHPMVSDGIRLYLTDYGQDRFGFPYAGFQFVKDPGQTGVWIGCGLFLVGLTGAIWLSHSCVVLRREGETLRVYVSSKGKRDEITGQLREALLPGSAILEEAP